jgi:ubiquinone/menaquinone biosynthesis C-methylase UbiE
MSSETTKTTTTPGSWTPSYYQKAFHAYETGNLSWEAAYEVEIASCAVGARNFPQFGSRGEEAFRDAFDSALVEAGATVPSNGRIVDLGCGTGMSTRRLAKNFPHAKAIVGIDLSPYFIQVGKRLLEVAPSSFHEGGPWVSTIQSDSRIQYLIGDAASALTLSDIDEGSFDAVNVQFVLHELPPEVARDVVDESIRLLKPRGQLWICEMDFESPAYAAQRANPLLFSLIRSTEPFLDEYAESISSLFQYIQTKFQHVTVVPATGRHFALVATKGDTGFKGPGTMQDLRFDDDGNYKVEDTHLQLWESKQ